MFKVECESCHAPYELDENRLPPGGLKMRCPKCGTSFMVRPPGEAAPAPVPSDPPKRTAKATVMGVGLPSAVGAMPKAMKGTIMGQPQPPEVAAALAAQQAKAPIATPFAVPKPAPPSAPPADDLGDLELPDLPAPKAGAAPAGLFGSAPPRPTAPAKPAAPPAATAPAAPAPAPKKGPIELEAPASSGLELDVDLPAPKAGGAKPGAGFGASAPGPVARSFGRPEAAKPVAPAPQPPAPAPSSLDDLEIDLPAKKATSPGAARPGAKSFDIDLPAPKPRVPAAEPVALPSPRPQVAGTPAPAPGRPAAPLADDFDLPAPKPAAPKPGAAPARPAPAAAPEPDAFDVDLDLPAPKPAAAAAAGQPRRAGGALDSMDLPTPKLVTQRADAPGGRRPTPIGGPRFDDLDLPMPKGPSGADLPAPKIAKPVAAPSFDDLDLPMPKSGADLPAPKGVADLPVAKGGGPSGFGDLDLPMPRGAADLPAPKGIADLPAPRGVADLPAPKGFDDLDLPLPKGVSDLPQPKIDADFPVARGGGDLPAPRSADAYGDLDIAPSAPPRAASIPAVDDRTRDGRAGAGGVGFGELDLGAGESAAPGTEFEDIPQEAIGQSGGTASARVSKPNVAQVDVSRRVGARIAVEEPTEKAKRSKLPYVVLVLLLLIAGAGVGVGLATPYGFFGMYAIEQFLPDAGSASQTRAAVERAETKAKSDTYPDVRESLRILAGARRETGLNRELLTRSLLHEALYQVRFGEDPASASRVAAIRRRLEERGGEAPGIALAYAADALRAGDGDQARSWLARARSAGANDPYYHLVAGELALENDENDAAAEAFRAAAEKGGGARALWGLARALLRGDDAAATTAAIDATLAQSPGHVAARLARARLAAAGGDVETALRMTREAAGEAPVDGETLRGSREQRAEAFALLGSLHERMQHRREAREAYEASLQADSYGVTALVGLGRVLLDEQRYRDALARFEAAASTHGADQPLVPGGRSAAAEARLGQARALLALDRPQDAKTVLAGLLESSPNDPDVLLWLGRAEEKLGDRAAAEQHLHEAITAAPQRFDAYLALAQVFYAANRPTEAEALMRQAEERVPDSADVRVIRGNAELERNELDRAIREYQRAIELDANHVGAHFGLGAAQRRAGRLDDADRAFEAVATRDPLYPGLALERGLVFEAKGESQRAARAYEHALRERPDDPDLLLRLGAAQVAAGQLDEAERTLRRVMEQRPNAAEGEHFMGRIAFARGQLPEALVHFNAALDRDATRAEFHLHAAWAHLELGDLGRALERVEQALTRDSSLGDAYWIRGRIRVRTGAVRDALQDLQRALELKPSRYDAYAAIGEAYDQLRRVGDAIRAYEQALDRDSDRGEWWYRLGRLRLDAGRESDAQNALQRATALGEAATPRPGWLADAHRIQGDALRLMGQRAGAIEHYRRYLEIAPPGGIDRSEVEDNLRDLGGGG